MRRPRRRRSRRTSRPLLSGRPMSRSTTSYGSPATARSAALPSCPPSTAWPALASALRTAAPSIASSSTRRMRIGRPKHNAAWRRRVVEAQREAMPDLDLSKARLDARRAVEAAAAASLAWFERGVSVELKSDQTPVTQADRESEAAVLAVVREAFPDHAFVGEESGAHAGTAGTRWIVDPLDGTKGFTRGGRFWGAVVALEHGGDIVAGAMALPALAETYWAAKGLGAWMRIADGAPVRLQVSSVGEWGRATLSFGEPKVLLKPPFLERGASLAVSAQS